MFSTQFGTHGRTFFVISDKLGVASLYLAITSILWLNPIDHEIKYKLEMLLEMNDVVSGLFTPATCPP